MEIELKLALPSADPQGLARSLAKTPLLAQRKAVQQLLHNTYYDTPEQALNRLRVALRLRRVGDCAAPTWLQTLKIGGGSESALSQRGEWETVVPGAQLDADALAATPWSTLDPDGALYPALAPCFTTEFARTTWTVRNRDGSSVEVALDIGQTTVDGKAGPICELELELLAGEPEALFAVAQQIAGTVATLPLAMSKAQRGYALARNALYAPQQARPPTLDAALPLAEAALRVLREAFSHCTANLHGLMHSDDPELVHQARIGWRRFKTALKLFNKSAGCQARAELKALRPMLNTLGALRDLEVTSLQTLPMLANAYTDGDPIRKAHWRAMEQAFGQAADQKRDALHAELLDHRVGSALLAVTRWLEVDLVEAAGSTATNRKHELQDWAREHIKRWHTQLKKALAQARQHPESAHRARILAKRLRYGIEAVRPLLTKRRAKHWHLQASRIQAEIGTDRDLRQALHLAAQMKVDPSLLDFLRGVGFGQQRVK
jgi:inorganic triphosphatase YgiF